LAIHGFIFAVLANKKMVFKDLPREALLSFLVY